jgi:4'-phosphopantetheinyl transferase
VNALELLDVHVWTVALERDPSILLGNLSEDEAARARRFHFQRDRDEFVVARGALRVLLGDYLACDPAVIRFAYGPHGKPKLADPANDLEFNLSHTHGLALVGLTRGRAIGIDVEQVRPFSEVAGLPSRIFSKRELADFERLPPHQREEAFFNAWTRKEALVKATGRGFSMNVREVEVTFAPSTVVGLLRLCGMPPTEAWSLRAVAVPADYAAAIAVAGPVRDVVVADWAP